MSLDDGFVGVLIYTQDYKVRIFHNGWPLNPSLYDMLA